MTEAPAVDMAKVEELAGQFMGYMTGLMMCQTMYLGERLGLFQAMQGSGPMTAADLAKKTGLHERWLTEWLRNQAAGGMVAYRGDERFELTTEQAMILADEANSPMFLAGGLQLLPAQTSLLDKLPESFRTGIGLDYDAWGPHGAAGVERMFAPSFRQMLVPVILPGLDGIVSKLEAGAKVADIGCGAGVALVTMGKAFPNSEFHGYDISKHALDRAEKNKADAGVSNVTFHDARAEALPSDGSFDFVTAFDCIHDMTNPAGALQAARKALKPEGTFLIADIQGRSSFEENLAENPMAAMMYGASLMGCMSSALSEPGGAGLGTLGFHENVAREMTAEAGFTRFTTHDFGNPFNSYYEVRP